MEDTRKRRRMIDIAISWEPWHIYHFLHLLHHQIPLCAHILAANDSVDTRNGRQIPATTSTTSTTSTATAATTAATKMDRYYFNQIGNVTKPSERLRPDSMGMGLPSGDLWRPLPTTSEDLWGPLRTSGDLWGPLGTSGEFQLPGIGQPAQSSRHSVAALFHSINLGN